MKSAYRDAPLPGARAGIFLIVASLFLVSGATGLIYQVAWTRLFTTVFGNTTHAVSAVLTSFMAGLGLGSYYFGKIADRQRRVLLTYALLEVGIGVAALLLPAGVESVESIYAGLYRTFPSSLWILTLAKAGISFLFLLVPTFLMGATLPVLGRFVVSRVGQVGSRVGLLYAVNTLGATLGCLITGFWLIEHFGVKGTIRVAAAANFGLALCFFLLHRLGGRAGAPIDSGGTEEADKSTIEESLSTDRRRIVLLAFGLGGFCSLAYEVLWFRVLVFQLKTTVYSFSLMLAAMLTGIALGSALFSAIEALFGRSDRAAPRDGGRYWPLFGYVEAAIGLLGIVSIPLFGRLETWSDTLSQSSFTGRMFWTYVMAGCVMFAPALLMGAAFPVVCRIWSRSASTIGASVGTVYAANTVGCIFGPIVTGFFLVRALGTQWSIMVIALVNIAVAALVLLKERSLKHTIALGCIVGAALAGVVSIPGNLLFEYFNVGEKLLNSHVKILYAHEGVECITTVHLYPDQNRVISTGSINVAGTPLTLRTTQKLQAHIPLLLHPAPKEVCQIGFGSGETSHIVTSYDVDRLDLVDISAGVLETSARFFDDINGGVVDHPRFNAIIMDGANYLRVTDKTYDIILNDATWPYLSGCNALYTVDHFAAGRARLKPGGIMTSWFPLDLAIEDFQILLKSFHHVFPHVQLWVGMTHRNMHSLVAGSMEPFSIDASRFLRRFGRYACSDLRSVDLDDPALFLSSLVMDQDALGPELDNLGLNTNDTPILEFAESRMSRRGTSANVLPSFQYMNRKRASILPCLRHVEKLGGAARDFVNDIDAAQRAAGHMLSGLIMREVEDRRFVAEIEQALAVYPNHPGALRILKKMHRLATLDTSKYRRMSPLDLLKTAEDLFRSGAFAKAEEVLAIGIEKDPNDHHLLYLLGVVLVRQERHAEGVAVLRKAVRIEPDLAPPWNNLGAALVSMGEIDAGIGAYRKALAIDPEFFGALNNLGTALVDKGRIEEGIVCYRKVLGRKPNMAETHYLLGLANEKKGRIDDAIRCCRKALAIEPAPRLDRAAVRAALDRMREAKNR